MIRINPGRVCGHGQLAGDQAGAGRTQRTSHQVCGHGLMAGDQAVPSGLHIRFDKGIIKS